MKIVVFTDYSTCIYCKKIRPIVNGAEFQGWLAANGFGFESADRSADPADYALLKRQYKFSGDYPAVFVVGDNGKKLTSFVARNYTAAKLIAKIKPYCASCSDTAAKTKTCPTCKGAGVVAAALMLLLSGCALTSGTYRPAKDGGQPELSFKRVALFYPFSLENVSFPGGVSIGKWGSTGGAAELVPLVDATGKVIGYVAEGAAKGAVK